MAYCGECKNFIRASDKAYGRCKVHKFIKTRSGKETNREFIPYQSRTACKQFYEKGTTITNYDRIRNMSGEEMADFLMEWAMRFALGKAPLNVKGWLESEAELE